MSANTLGCCFSLQIYGYLVECHSGQKFYCGQLYIIIIIIIIPLRSTY
jgi:hypothetical protein